MIATLWRVEDQGAAEFAARFYRYFPASPPPEALALAQRDMLADARYQAPYYWAGYLVSGEGEVAAGRKIGLDRPSDREALLRFLHRRISRRVS